jgi:hypothetical protein
MRLSILCVLFLAPCVVADDWEDFTNNLATDLVCLISVTLEKFEEYRATLTL